MFRRIPLGRTTYLRKTRWNIHPVLFGMRAEFRNALSLPSRNKRDRKELGMNFALLIALLSLQAGQETTLDTPDVSFEIFGVRYDVTNVVIRRADETNSNPDVDAAMAT